MIEIPDNIRSPGVFAAIHPAGNKAPGANYSILCLGHTKSDSLAIEKNPEPFSNPLEAEKKYGKSSQLFQMLEYASLNNDTNEIYAMKIAEASGKNASAEITITTSQTGAEENGVLTFYIDCIRINTQVLKGDNHQKILTEVQKNLGDISELPVVATLDNEQKPTKIVLKSVHKGLSGNYIDLRDEYYGDEKRPKGVGLIFSGTRLSGGTGTPDYQNIFKNCGDARFDFLIIADSDPQTLSHIKEQLEARWKALDASDGTAIFATNLPYNEAIKITTKEGDPDRLVPNCPHICGIGAFNFPQSPWKIAAASAGRIVASAQSNPAIPFDRLKIAGLKSPKITDSANFSTRNNALFKGLSTLKTDFGGNVMTERVITTYIKNSSGHNDDSWLDINIPLVLSRMRQEIVYFFSAEYEGALCLNDGEDKVLKPGIKAITPSQAMADALFLFSDFQERGWVTDKKYFEKHLVAEKSDSQRGRINLYIKPTLAEPFMVMGIDVGFIA